MPRSLSSRIAKFNGTVNAPKKTARHFKVSLHVVREAIHAWEVINTLSPLISSAEDTLRRIDGLGPASDDRQKNEANRLREARKRCGILLYAAASAAKLSASKYSLIERGLLSEPSPFDVACKIQRSLDSGFDTGFVLNGRRGSLK